MGNENVKTLNMVDFITEVDRLIGRINSGFATWDLHVNSLIVSLVKPETEIPKAKLNDNSTLGQKLIFLNELTESQVTNASILAKFKADFFSKMSDIAKERNRFIHDQLAVKMKEGRFVIIRIKFVGLNEKRFRFEQKEVELDEIRAFSEEIGNWGDPLFKLVYELQGSNRK